MVAYESNNFINVKNEVPFPITEMILNVVFLAISILVVFMIFQQISPILLLTDLKELNKCSIDNSSIIEQLQNELQQLPSDNIKEISKIKQILDVERQKNKAPLSEKCKSLLSQYSGQDLSKVKTFMTISIFYTTMFLSFKIISSTYTN